MRREIATCSVAKCRRDSAAKGLCPMHYKRLGRTGDPLGTRPLGPTARSEEERFWEKVEKTPTCWVWKGAKASRYGHGKFMVKRAGRWRNRKAHRYAYELLVGPIPEGLTLDHLCRNPACVNPSHLEPVTLAENSRRQGAARTKCRNGHPYTEENVYRDPTTGHRHCRTCRRENDQSRRSSGASTALR